MFQRATTLLLIFCIIGSGFSKLVVFAGFEMNQRYIATTLCENRDKPQLNCNGHCYFMKKVKQAEEKEKNNERQTQKELIQQVFLSDSNRFVFSSTLLQAFHDGYRDMALQSGHLPYFAAAEVIGLTPTYVNVGYLPTSIFITIQSKQHEEFHHHT